MHATDDQYRGAMLGLALGDAMGAPHEGGPLERLLWRILGRTSGGRRRYTDDTQMSLDLADSLLARGHVDQDDLAQRFARGYRWDRGYGPGAARLLRCVRAGTPWREASRCVHPDGSFGNGAAMRAPVIALFFRPRRQDIAPAARLQAEVTHAHPLGIEGAVLLAEATAASLDGTSGRGLLDQAAGWVRSDEFRERLAVARACLGAGHALSPRELRARLGMGITATQSCLTALYLSARFESEPFAAMLAFAAEAGGDVDTVSAMAGALWGARHGAKALPAAMLAQLEAAERIAAVALQLDRLSCAQRARDPSGT